MLMVMQVVPLNDVLFLLSRSFISPERSFPLPQEGNGQQPCPAFAKFPGPEAEILWAGDRPTTLVSASIRERIVSKRNRSNRNEKLPALFAPIMQPKLVQFVSGLLRSLTTRTHPYEELHDSTKLQDMV